MGAGVSYDVFKLTRIHGFFTPHGSRRGPKRPIVISRDMNPPVLTETTTYSDGTKHVVTAVLDGNPESYRRSANAHARNVMEKYTMPNVTDEQMAEANNLAGEIDGPMIDIGAMSGPLQMTAEQFAEAFMPDSEQRDRFIASVGALTILKMTPEPIAAVEIPQSFASEIAIVVDGVTYDLDGDVKL